MVRVLLSMSLELVVARSRRLACEWLYLMHLILLHSCMVPRTSQEMELTFPLGASEKELGLHSIVMLDCQSAHEQ